MDNRHNTWLDKISFYKNISSVLHFFLLLEQIFLFKYTQCFDGMLALVLGFQDFILFLF